MFTCDHCKGALPEEKKPIYVYTLGEKKKTEYIFCSLVCFQKFEEKRLKESLPRRTAQL